jgi:hypothetical protein
MKTEDLKSTEPTAQTEETPEELADTDLEKVDGGGFIFPGPMSDLTPIY